MLTIEHANINVLLNDYIQVEAYGFSNLSSPVEEIKLDKIAKNPISIDGKGVNLIDKSLKFYDENDYIGLISESISNDLGLFSPPPEIRIYPNESEKNDDDKITIKFERDFCKEVLIQYYGRDAYGNIREQDSDVLYPTSNVITFKPLFWDEYINIVFIQTNTPNSFVRISRLVVGEITVFDKFKNTNLLEEINVISSDLPINEFSAGIISEKELELSENSKINLYANGNYFGRYYIKTVEPTGENYYNITARNAIDLLAEQSYYGSVSVVSRFLSTEFHRLPLDIKVEGYSAAESIYGAIPPNNWRYALCACAWGSNYMIDASRSDKIIFKKIPQSVKTIIDNNSKRIIGNATFEKTDLVTEIVYRYSKGFDFEETDIIVNNEPNTATTFFYSDKDAPVEFEFEDPEGPHFDFTVELNTAYMIRFVSSKTPTTIPVFKVNLEEFEENFFIQSASKPKKLEFKEFNTRSNWDFEDKKRALVNYAKSKGKVKAKIVLYDEKVGDLITIETKNNGMITGVITSINIVSFGYEIIANIEVLEWQNG